MISLEKFKKVISLIQQNDKRVSDLYAIGIDLLNMEDYVYTAYRIVLEELFQSDSVLDTIDWWLYEHVEKYVYYKGDDGEEIKLDLTTVEDLYDYITNP